MVQYMYFIQYACTDHLLSPCCKIQRPLFYIILTRHSLTSCYQCRLPAGFLQSNRWCLVGKPAESSSIISSCSTLSCIYRIMHRYSSITCQLLVNVPARNQATENWNNFSTEMLSDIWVTVMLHKAGRAGILIPLPKDYKDLKPCTRVPQQLQMFS